MPVIYNVTIDETGKENHFQVTWQNPESKTKDFAEYKEGIQ